MATDATILAVGVETKGIPEATSGLAGLTAQAGKAEQAARVLGDGFNSQLSTLAKTEQANNALVESWAKEVVMLGKTKSEMMELEAAHNKFNETQMANVRVLQGQVKAYEDAQKAAKDFADEQEASSARIANGISKVADAAKIVAAALVALYGISIKNAMEAEQANLRLEAVLTATGGAAGVTKDHIDDLADSMAVLTEFDDESLRKAAGTLLTFGNVGVTSFDRTMKAGADLAAFMGTDLNNAVRMLGKALEAPEVGMTALRRAGVVLTDSQIALAKAAVDAGDKMEAQRIILDSIEGKVGGVAEKMNTGLLKATKDVSKGFDEMTESMGKSAAFGGTYITTMEGIAGALRGVKKAIDEAKLGDVAAMVNPALQFMAQGNLGNDKGPSVSGKITQGNAAELEREANAQNMVTEARKKAGEALGKLIASYADEKQKLAESESALRTNMATLNYSNAQIEQQVQLMRKHASASADSAAAKRAESQVMKDFAANMKEALAAEERERQVQIAAAKDLEKFHDAYDKLNTQSEKRVAKMEEEAEAESRRAQMIGLTKEQVNLLKAAWDEEAIAKAQSTMEAAVLASEDEAEIARLARKVEALKKLQQARRDAADAEAGVEVAKENAKLAQEAEKNWESMYKNVAGFAGDFLVDFAQNGKSAFTNLWDSFKNMAYRALAELATKQIMLSIGASITSGGAAAGGLAGSGSGLGSFSSLGGSWLSGIGDSVFGGGGGSAFGAGFSSPLSTLKDVGSTLFSGGEFASGNLAFASTVGALVPVIGSVLAVGSLIKGFLDSKKGGPKSGGFGSTGDISGITGTDNSGRWFTPNSADSGLGDITKGVETAYQTALKSLGGSGSAGFALGYDTDPQGGAPNRVHAGTFVNGQQTYNASYGDLGRDDAKLEATMQLEAKRMLLAALQASDLPQQIASVLKSVSAQTADADAIDKVVEFGTAMQGLLTVLDGSVVEDAQKAWEESQRTTSQVLGDMGEEVIRLSGSLDGSVESMQQLTTATSDYRNAIFQTLIAIQQIKAQVSEMFGATRDTLETYGLSPQALYDRYRKDADAAAELLHNSSDPEQISKLAERINADINTAFNALDASGKSQQQNPLINYLDEVNAFVQQKLTDLGAGITQDTEAPFEAARNALNDAASRFNSAADVQQSAAITQKAASETIADAASALSGGVQRFISQLPISVRVTTASSGVNG